MPLVLAACGTRLEDSELGLGDGGGSVVTSAVDAAAEATNGAGSVPGPVQGDPASAGAETGAGTAPRAGIPSGSNSGSRRGTTESPGAALQGDSETTSGRALSTPDAPCTKALDPINIGQNGTFSGFLQGSLQGFRPGLAAWAADVNSRGGVQCHPIRLFQVDDGSNPAKTVSNTQDLIENKKVVAMVGAVVPFNITSYRSVVDPAGIPTIGGDNVDLQWEKDPLLFPTGVTLVPGMALGMKASAERTGKKKFSIVYCVESAACAQANQFAQDMAKAAGVTIVNTQSVSLTQTDYTSNCQTAKNAGAESVLAVFDSSALHRFFRSCAAISYFPPSATIGLAVGAASAADPNVQKAGVTVTPTNAPYFTASIPAVAEFRRIMARYAPGIEPDNSSMSAYASGRLFEAALARVASEARGGPVTTALILRGLHSIKNEKLGGLAAAPLTFKAGEPHPAAPCAFITVVQTGGIVDPLKGRSQCLGVPLNTSNDRSQQTSADLASALRSGSASWRRGRTPGR